MKLRPPQCTVTEVSVIDTQQYPPLILWFSSAVSQEYSLMFRCKMQHVHLNHPRKIYLQCYRPGVMKDGKQKLQRDHQKRWDNNLSCCFRNAPLFSCVEFHFTVFFFSCVSAETRLFVLSVCLLNHKELVHAGKCCFPWLPTGSATFIFCQDDQTLLRYALFIQKNTLQSSREE